MVQGESLQRHRVFELHQIFPGKQRDSALPYMEVNVLRVFSSVFSLTFCFFNFYMIMELLGFVKVKQ